MMSQTQPIHLIVGADGLVGGALFRRLRNAGKSVVGTTRKRAGVNESYSYLDLAEPAGEWKFPWPVSVAIICAGVTKAQACKDDPVSTAAINVEGISSLASTLVAAGAFVIFLSTNQVFDGSTPRQEPDARLCPATEYGRQKAEVERRIAEHGDSVAIVRFAKILGSRPSLIAGWIDSLRGGKPIHPFSDMTLAPIPLSCAVTALTLVAQLRLPGILQVSGDEDIPYAEAARAGARALGADPRLVQPVAASEVGTLGEPIPLHTTLNMDRLMITMGIVPPAARWTIETAFGNPHLLSGL